MRDGELPDISVLGSNCLMAKEEFGTVVATEGSLPPGRPSRPVRSDLGLNPEACHSIWVTSGKKVGNYVGRVAVRASGSFNIRTSGELVQGISHKYCHLVQRADGYGYFFNYRA